MYDEWGPIVLVPANVGADPYIPLPNGDPYVKNPAGGFDLPS